MSAPPFCLASPYFVRVADVYEQFCDALLMPGGLAGSGPVTDAIFLDQICEVWGDFLSRTEIAKAFAAMQGLAGEGEYDLPDEVVAAEQVFWNERPLGKDTMDSVAISDSRWRARRGTPETYVLDRQGGCDITIVPRPSSSGSVTASDPPPFYGTVGGSANGSSIEVDSDSAFYGVISDIKGPEFFDVSGPLLGTISALIPLRGNAGALCSVRSLRDAVTFDCSLYGIPDMFTAYVKYGLLAKVYGGEHELKDTLKARYCRARFDEGVSIARGMLGTEAG